MLATYKKHDLCDIEYKFEAQERKGEDEADERR